MNFCCDFVMDINVSIQCAALSVYNNRQVPAEYYFTRKANWNLSK